MEEIEQAAPFFPKDQIALIQSGLMKALEAQPFRDKYIQCIVENLPLYNGTHQEADLASDDKLLPSLEYISDSDLMGEYGLINRLVQAYFLFLPDKSPKDNNEIVFRAVSDFIRGAYLASCWLFDGVPDKRKLDTAKVVPPVIIRDSTQAIWIYGADADGRTKLTKSAQVELYAELDFKKEISGSSRVEMPYPIYEDFKQLNAHRYPGYNQPRKKFNLTDSSRIYANHLERFTLNFKAACVNHDSRPFPSSLNPRWALVFEQAIEEYCKLRRISISELDTFVALRVTDEEGKKIIHQGIVEVAVNILASMAKKYIDGYDLRLFGQYEFTEALEGEFKKDLFQSIDKTFIPVLRRNSVLPEPEKYSQLYDNQVEALIKFLIPQPPEGVVICPPFTLRNDKQILKHEKQSGENKLTISLRKSPKVLYTPLNLNGGHWVRIKCSKSKSHRQFVSDYKDSMSVKSWVLPALNEFVQNAEEADLNAISFREGRSEGTGKQRTGDGFTCGDRVVWDLFESIYPGEVSPWRYVGLTEDSDPGLIREVSFALLEMAKRKDEMQDWKVRFDKDELKHARPIFQNLKSSEGRSRGFAGSSSSGNATKCWFDDHGFLLFLTFSLAVLCFVAVGFGLTALVGSGDALEVAAKFFVVPAALSLKSAAFISVLAGGIGGPVILYTIWDALVNVKNDIIKSFTPLPKETTPPPLPVREQEIPQPGNSQQKYHAVKGPTMYGPPVSQTPATFKTFSALPGSQQKPMEYPTSQL